MDFSDFKKSLAETRDIGGPIHNELAAPGDENQGASLAEEIFARHQGKISPESRQICAVLSGVLDVIASQGLQPTPAALFAAISTALSSQDIGKDIPTSTALFNLLDIILTRVSSPVIKSRAFGVIKVAVDLLANIDNTTEVHSNLKVAIIPPLAHLLAATGPEDWVPVSRGFAIILASSFDQKPRVRKKAQTGLVDILSSFQSSSPLLSTASDSILKQAQQVLTKPRTTAEAASMAPSKKRRLAEEAITSSVLDALHLMGALKHIISLVTETAAQEICKLILQLFYLRQPLLSQHGIEVLTAYITSQSSNLPARTLIDLLRAVLEIEDFRDIKVLESHPGIINLLRRGIDKLTRNEPAAAASLSAGVVSLMIPLLNSHQVGVRRTTVQGLKDVIAVALLNDNDTHQVLPPTRKRASPSRSVIAAIESTLGPQYQDAWELALQLSEEVFCHVGRQRAGLAAGILHRVAKLCERGEDIAMLENLSLEDIKEEKRLASAACSAYGSAIRSLGPQAVLEMLPMQLEEGLNGQVEARPWVLPLLKIYTREAQLSYWTDQLFPVAKNMAARAASSSNQHESTICATLDKQVWDTLPSFATWSNDVGSAFGSLTKAILPEFEQRPDLRPIICITLCRLAEQTSNALKFYGQAVGYPNPLSIMPSDDGDDKLTLDSADESSVDIPTCFTEDHALKSLQALRTASQAWLPLLLNAYLDAPMHQRMEIAAAISAYACICEGPLIAAVFRTAVSKYMKVLHQQETGELGPDAVLQGGDDDVERQTTYMELALLLSGGLNENGLSVLWKMASNGSQDAKSSVQKKSYKVLAYICEKRGSFLASNLEGAVVLLLDRLSSVKTAARRYRLQCLKSVALELITQKDTMSIDWKNIAKALSKAGGSIDDGGNFQGQQDVVQKVLSKMIGEIIFSLKESNKRSRSIAFGLLIDIARSMNASDPARPMEGHGGGLFSLLTMVLGGLVGASSHMLSASVMALARLLYEFAPALVEYLPNILPTILLLFRSSAREVIKAALGFIKVVTVRMPRDELPKYVGSICESILLWASDSRNKFRSTVRVIIERLAVRCGFDVLGDAIPEAHRPLLTHIRKSYNRRHRNRASSRAGDIPMEELDGGEDMRSVRSHAKTAKTAKTLAWKSELFFDDDEDDIDDDEEGMHDGKSTAFISTAGGGPGKMSSRQSQKALGRRSVLSAPAGNTLQNLPGHDAFDLLDPMSSRRVGIRDTRNADGGTRMDFSIGSDGRMVIKEESMLNQKRKRSEADEAGFDSEDSDFEDLKNISGLSLAIRGAKSVDTSRYADVDASGGASKRQGGKSGLVKSTAEGRRSSQHTGDKFKSRKAGGDVKGKAKVEPYAYWPLDRKLLNRRAAKSRGAKKGLDKVINTGKSKRLKTTK